MPESIAEPMLRLRHPLSHAQARFGDILDPQTQEKLDEAVVTYFAAPHSYTGEDVVEIAAHGSPIVLETLVSRALFAGARMAEPGEFTQRAFLSGRLDLTQAEAVRDLIEAQTLYQARVAAQQLEGALSRRITPIKQQLVDLIVLLEAGIDFAEDDIEVTAKDEILSRLAAVTSALQPVAESFLHGRIVHAGLTLAIVGRANAGKSSIFNCVVERERAIVTATPGTTRDLVTERVSLGGIPVELVDTAGLREAQDEAEQIGIRKSREALADADIVLLVLDGTQPLLPEEKDLLAALQYRPAIVIVNKIDLPQAPLPADLTVSRTSALRGEGIRRSESPHAGPGARQPGRSGKRHADQPPSVPGSHCIAHIAKNRRRRRRAKHPSRDGAARPLRSPAPPGLPHRRNHCRRNPKPNLLHLLHWEIERNPASSVQS